jgi:hypothetical protein
MSSTKSLLIRYRLAEYKFPAAAADANRLAESRDMIAPLLLPVSMTNPSVSHVPGPTPGLQSA